MHLESREKCTPAIMMCAICLPIAEYWEVYEMSECLRKYSPFLLPFSAPFFHSLLHFPEALQQSIDKRSYLSLIFNSVHSFFIS